MADVVVYCEGRESSVEVELVDDDALVDFTGTPAVSNIALVARAGVFSLFIEAIPETAHAIHLEVQSSPHKDRATYYTQWDANKDDVNKDILIFKQATNTDPVEIGPFYGATHYLRVIYGYVGGTGSGASLKVYLVARASA